MQSVQPQPKLFQSLKVIIAGGGTGGHLFPGIALAEGFQDKNSATQILFAGTGNRLEKTALSSTPFRHVSISAGGLKGKAWHSRVKAIFRVVIGIWESMGIIHQFKPNLVVGVGGYVSGPMALAARLIGVPVVLHEQNMIPGLTNRVLAKVAKRIYVTFPQTHLTISKEKVKLTGNPIRKSMANMAKEENDYPSAPPSKQRQFTVLVFGGSQGAHMINNAVIEALAYLPQKEDLFFIHQTGEADECTVQDVYQGSGVAARVQAFFSNMADQYQEADLVICRAGATTIAELTAVGKATIFIPYPFAADDHQTKNAQGMADAGAAEMIHEKDLTGAALAARISHYIRQPQKLKKMAAMAARYGRPNAAADIVEDCYQLLAA
jgi:UDP-N-acetylglucosamine--N-acetylmuramyl-(pentapeptide) pyrophosphoryl-undecaprenol N-acetylglucosamine transferase